MSILKGLQSRIAEWSADKWQEIIKTVRLDLLDFTDQLFYVFVIAAIVGCFFIIVGEKRIGTKITSISFFTYLIIRVVVGGGSL